MKKIVSVGVISLLLLTCGIPSICLSMKNKDSTLVGFWNFNEDSGAIAYDTSDYNNDGIVNGASWTTGIDDNALSFDGNDYVDAGTDESLKPNLPISISAWINIDETNEAYAIIFTNGRWDYPLDYYGCTMGFNVDHKISVGYGDGDTGPVGRRSLHGTTILDFDTWHHVVGIIKGPTDMGIYINGINDGGTYSGTGGDIAYSDGPSYIGQDGSFENFFSGIIDEIKVFHGALTENEIIDLFKEPFDSKILIGKISNLNSEEHIMYFDAEDLRVISLNPFEFRRYSSGEKVTVLYDKIGILTTNFALGLFKTII
jgi:hypothetical protein